MIPKKELITNFKFRMAIVEEGNTITNSQLLQVLKNWIIDLEEMESVEEI